jgi:hypothetical protein
MGHGWMALSPTPVQSHWSLREVTGGHEVVMEGVASLPLASESGSDDGTKELPEDGEKTVIVKMYFPQQKITNNIFYPIFGSKM